MAAVASALAGSGRAEDMRFGSLIINGAFVRATTVSTSAAYLFIAATDATGDTLLSASSPVAGRVELHTVLQDGDVVRMRPIKSIAITSGRPAHLKPGGDHIMLMDLKAPLRPDQRISLRLHFSRAGTVELDVPVVTGNAPPALPPHEHMRR